MNLKHIQALISNHKDTHDKMIEGDKYYFNNNNIINKGTKSNDILRRADNRISHNFHQVMVDEKASYMFSYPIIIDTENEYLNEQITLQLGAKYEKTMNQLCVEASNKGVAWLHYWTNVDNLMTKKQFNYAVVPSEQVIPIYTNDLNKSLASIIRYYSTEEYEGDNKVTYGFIEYWSSEDYIQWKIKDSVTGNEVLEQISLKHTFEKPPYIPFKNNNLEQSDLCKYKHLIDLYDKVVSGYANDLEDIQEIIYVLQGYGGEDLNEFVNDLKTYKAIKTGMDGGGVNTLQIDIPIEARRTMLDILRKQIYESGQALQQDNDVSNTSGVAMKFFYRRLELKAGLMQTEFKVAIEDFIKALLKVMFSKEGIKINQIWTRNMINNDLELTQIASQSLDILPLEIILRNHPWIENEQDIQLALSKLNNKTENTK